MKHLISFSFLMASLTYCFTLMPSSASAHKDRKKDKMEMMKNMTPEQRQNMATLHDSMAKCLRTEKEATMCWDEMKQSCTALGEAGCPMHGHMDMDKGSKKMKK